MRGDDEARTTFAGAGAGRPGGEPSVRRSAALGDRMAVRLIAAPFAALAAGLAGVLFAVLLPICGIATICEGIATTSWRFLRETFDRLPHPGARRI